MPGLVGIIGLDRPVRKMENCFDAMAKGIRSCTGDHYEKTRSTQCLAGVASISHASDSSAFVANADRTVLCLIDGEVFIDPEISLSEFDSRSNRKILGRQEYLPYLYEKYGVDFIKFLSGCFNILIIERKKRRYRVVNSRFGMRVMYLTQIDGYLLLSSSIKSFIQCPHVSKSINKKAVIEYALFHYPLGEDTFLEKVSVLEPATVLTIKGSEITEAGYWDQRSLFGHKILSLEESIDGTDYRLARAVKQMRAASDRIGVSLTGGFDTRTVLSLLDNNREKILLYSFGSHISRDVVIPESISNHLGYDYHPIYLDGDYENQHFNRYAMLAIEHSDGRSSIARAHYPYAFGQIGKEVDAVLTGICGSELLRPLSNVGTVISKKIRLLYERGVDFLSDIGSTDESLRYYHMPKDGDIINQIKAAAHTMKSFRDNTLTLNQRLYVFVLKEVLRKYFGPEMAMESPYVYNRTPYLDRSFIDFVFKTPFCGANFSFCSRSLLERMQGQQFYAYIIGRHNPELTRMKTDRNFAPRDLMTNVGKIRIAKEYFLSRTRRKQADDYGLRQGVKMFFLQNRGKILTDSGLINTERVSDDFNSGEWITNMVEFCKAISFAVWHNSHLA
jgi:asparagine synthetase B (glutamine-hydrolysing)